MTMPDDHVEDERLALHFLDDLDPAESDVVHRHLQGCAACAERADELTTTLSALALLDDPAVRPATGRPAHVVPHRRSRRRRVARAAGLLVLAATLAGLGVAALVGGPAADRGPAVVTVAATGTGTASGTGASVLLTEEDGSTTVRATVSGLPRGVAYVLYAVTGDGVSHPVDRWTGGSANADVGGVLDGVPLDRLSFFTVASRDGDVVISVYLPGAAGAPGPSTRR